MDAELFRVKNGVAGGGCRPDTKHEYGRWALHALLKSGDEPRATGNSPFPSPAKKRYAVEI